MKKGRKEKLGAKNRCLARSQHRERWRAHNKALVEAVHVLQDIEAGRLHVKDVSQKRRDAGAYDAAHADLSGQSGYEVLRVMGGKKGKKRKKGQSRHAQLQVIGPNGKMGQYSCRTLRGLNVRPGDWLRWHTNAANPRRSYFTRDY